MNACASAHGKTALLYFDMDAPDTIFRGVSKQSGPWRKTRTVRWSVLNRIKDLQVDDLLRRPISGVHRAR
ncbi:hypothetical protein THICB3250029 [Thiomonas sp. CB3]|nr:hypothetical protein THICB3250029 [Thiomonas sp. CB3]